MDDADREVLVRALRSAVGETHVLVDPDTASGHTTDWTGRWSGPTTAVVRPASTTEVVAVLRACADAGVAVVPQGGNTGLVGGGVPRAGEVVLSLRRLDDVGPVDVDGAAVEAGAGATLAAVQAAARRHGLDVGVDLAARDAATVGGMVATNAGGLHVVAHGSMRQQVRGLEAVLADGTVLRRLPGLAKDNAGYDWPQLLVGSEGTLAVVTRVALRLVPAARATTTCLLGCPTVADAVGVLGRARSIGPLRAVELIDAAGLRLVGRHRGSRPPLELPDDGAAVLVEWSSPPGADSLAALVGTRPALVAQDAADVAALWAWREELTVACAAAGVVSKLDVTVPPPRIAAVLERLRVIAPRAVAFGHLAEGTLHLNLWPPGGQPAHDADGGVGGMVGGGAGIPDVEAAVLALVAEHGGSIASEHGVGVAKVAHLHLTRSAAEVEAMWRLKDALDPSGLLNPGAVLPPRPSPTAPDRSTPPPSG